MVWPQAAVHVMLVPRGWFFCKSERSRNAIWSRWLIHWSSSRLAMWRYFGSFTGCSLGGCHHIWWFPKKQGYPQSSSILYNRMFPHKPTIVGYPHDWKAPIIGGSPRFQFVTGWAMGKAEGRAPLLVMLYKYYMGVSIVMGGTPIAG